MSDTGFQLLLNTCPDLETARKLARALVEQRLAACVNILPGVQSVYTWQGQVEEGGESLLLIKTRAALYPQVEDLVRREHPYEVPELVALDLVGGLPAYLQWLGESTLTAE